jgi:hypothetical protein
MLNFEGLGKALASGSTIHNEIMGVTNSGNIYSCSAQNCYYP